MRAAKVEESDRSLEDRSNYDSCIYLERLLQKYSLNWQFFR